MLRSNQGQGAFPIPNRLLKGCIHTLICLLVDFVYFDTCNLHNEFIDRYCYSWYRVGTTSRYSPFKGVPLSLTELSKGFYPGHFTGVAGKYDIQYNEIGEVENLLYSVCIRATISRQLFHHIVKGEKTNLIWGIISRHKTFSARQEKYFHFGRFVFPKQFQHLVYVGVDPPVYTPPPLPTPL